MRGIAVAGMCLVALASPAAAQEADWTRLEAIRPGRLVRVDGPTFPRWQASFDKVDADSLYTREAGVPRTVPRETVRRVYVLGKATKTGAIIGGVVGGLGGGALLTIGCAIGRSDDGNLDNDNQWADCTAIGLVGGAAVGAGLGAAIGSLFPHWHLRYRTF